MQVTIDRKTEQPAVRAAHAAHLDVTTFFVKLAYGAIGFATLAYFLIRMRADGSFAVAAEQASVGLLYGVMALIVVFGVAIVSLSFRKPER